MTIITRIIFLFLLGLSAAVAAQTERPIALVGGMLIDGYEGAVLHHAAVIVQGERIIAVGAAKDMAIPDNAVVIDTSGQTMMPGLIDLHMHLDLIGHGDYDEYYDFIGGMERLPDMMPIAAKQMMRAGVTSALDLGTPFQILDTRKRIDEGEIPGPRLSISGPWITRVKLDGVPDDYQMVIESPRDAIAAVRELVRRGSDVIKTWVGLTAEDYVAIVREAHAAGLKVHAHLYDPDAIRMAIDAGVDVFQHVGSARNPPYDAALVLEIAHKNIPIVQTIAHRIWVYPATVAFPERLQSAALKEDLPPDVYAEMQRSFENFHRNSYFREVEREIRHSKIASRQFIEAGAVMGVGTDAASPLNVHSEAMWREMAALVDSGMSNAQVISAATKTNAEILGKARDLGTIQPGKLADIIIVDGDPLSDINVMGRVIMTMKGGMIWYPRNNLSAQVREIGRPYNP